jgi:carboxymethylenebutenolidase
MGQREPLRRREGCFREDGARFAGKLTAGFGRVHSYESVLAFQFKCNIGFRVRRVAMLKPAPPKTDLSRREFVLGSIAVGFAAAVRPVAAETVITTDTSGLEAGEVKIPVTGGEIPGYRAMPAKAAKRPVVLVVQEIFGVHEHIRDVCRRFAKLGYFAVAPELYARQGDVSSMTDMQEIVSKVVSKVPDAQVMSDLDATVAWAAKTGAADTAKLGITGFCWGGRIVWLYAAHSPKLRAGVAWYGRLASAATELQPRQPLDVVRDLRAPVLGLYGGADQGIPLADVEKMRSALAAAGKPSEIVVYPDAPHGFHADYRPSYRPDDAKDGWNRLRAWFEKHGVA